MERSIARFMSPLGLLIFGVAEFGCYTPRTQDGGLRCKPDAGTRSCPEGFKCHVESQLCWKSGDGGVDQKIDGPGGPDLDASNDADGPICFQQLAGCAPETGLCDPFCQTG